MPIRIPDALPAHDILESENIFVMTEYRAMHQNIRSFAALAAFNLKFFIVSGSPSYSSVSHIFFLISIIRSITISNMAHPIFTQR